MSPFALLLLLGAAAGSPPVVDARPPFSITLKGSASLGTYQGAFNWTVIRIIRSARASRALSCIAPCKRGMTTANASV